MKTGRICLFKLIIGHDDLIKPSVRCDYAVHVVTGDLNPFQYLGPGQRPTSSFSWNKVSSCAYGGCRAWCPGGFSLLQEVVVDDKNFAGTLKRSLEKAMAGGAHQIRPNSWKLLPIWLRMVSWLCYGLVRFMTGMTGYAPGKVIMNHDPF